MGVGAALAPDEALDAAVDAALDVALVLVMLAAVLPQLMGSSSHRRSRLPSSTDSKFHRRRSPCMALNRAHPRRE